MLCKNEMSEWNKIMYPLPMLHSWWASFIMLNILIEFKCLQLSYSAWFVWCIIINIMSITCSRVLLSFTHLPQNWRLLATEPLFPGYRGGEDSICPEKSAEFGTFCWGKVSWVDMWLDMQQLHQRDVRRESYAEDPRKQTCCVCLSAYTWEGEWPKS